MSDKYRYLTALHAMQSGVAMKQNFDPSETTPKQMRVGINSAMVKHGALVTLLIEKKVFTLAEFDKVLADKMEAEVKLYEAELEKFIGNKVSLG
jgi:hypothetical protein